LRNILRRIDVLGCFLLGGWVGALIIAISLVTNSTHDEYTWSSPEVIACLATAGTVLVLLIIWEVWVVPHPVVPIELLHKQTPIAVAINNLTTAAVSFASVRITYDSLKLDVYGTALLPDRSIDDTFLGRSTSFTSFNYRYFGILRKWNDSQSDRSIILVDSDFRCFHLLWDSTNFNMDIRDSRVCTLYEAHMRYRMWTDFPLCYIGGSATSTLTIVALVGAVGRQGIAAATGCMSIVVC
jgi:hypothetical protein